MEYNRYSTSQHLIYIAFILIVILLFINIDINLVRKIIFNIMILTYKVYSLFGHIAWTNPYPIDYPYGREDLIPVELMLKFNHICYYRIINSESPPEISNDVRIEGFYSESENESRIIPTGVGSMKNIITDIHAYCINNLKVQTARKLIELYPFQNEEDYEKMKFLIKMKHPFVIKNGNWKTNKNSINTTNIFEKYGNTTVMFDKDHKTFRDKLSTMKEHNAYLSNSTSFMKKHKEIINNDDIELLAKMTGLENTINQIFLSLISNNGTPMHSAFSHNFFFMVEGRKKWTFWHPDYLCLVYPYFPKHAIYMGSYTCLRDLNVDDMSAFPLLKYAPYYEIILEEGDVLFNPGPWWHAIRNITPTTLGIATRWFYNDIFPSPNLLQYCQITNPNLIEIFEKIYTVQGNLKFDIDENYAGEINDESVSLIEVLNHDALKMCKINDRYIDWH